MVTDNASALSYLLDTQCCHQHRLSLGLWTICILHRRDQAVVKRTQGYKLSDSDQKQSKLVNGETPQTQMGRMTNQEGPADLVHDDDHLGVAAPNQQTISILCVPQSSAQVS